MTKPSGKTTAIIAYCTFIGMFIAISLNHDKKNAFATWHIKNMFGLVLLLLLATLTQYNVNLLLGDILYYIAVIFWLLSLSMAIQNKKQGIPILSEKFQEWFQFLGATS